MLGSKVDSCRKLYLVCLGCSASIVQCIVAEIRHIVVSHVHVAVTCHPLATVLISDGHGLVSILQHDCGCHSWSTYTFVQASSCLLSAKETSALVARRAKGLAMGALSFLSWRLTQTMKVTAGELIVLA